MSSNVKFDLPNIEKGATGNFRPINPSGSFYGKHQQNKTPNPMALPLIKESEIYYDDPPQKLTGFGLEIASSVIGTLVSHPCLVLRRQCQVNKKALRYHLTPFTIIPVILRLQNRQGMKTLWKGAGGIFILRGIGVGLETVIAEVTPFPREISASSPLKHVAQHLLLKSLAYGIITPFLCSSLVETVQSDIASETPGVLDCLKDGIQRIFKLGTPQSTRLIPIWHLIGPNIAYSLANYIISLILQSSYLWILSMYSQQHMLKQGAISKKMTNSATKYFDDLSAVHFSQMVAQMVLYPAETVLNRLYLQGTRTIIDNLDSGISVLPVITEYENFSECYHTIINEEGTSGLYKGFGALILEYTLQAVIIKIARTVFQEVTKMFSAPNHREQT